MECNHYLTVWDRVGKGPEYLVSYEPHLVRCRGPFGHPKSFEHLNGKYRWK